MFGTAVFSGFYSLLISLVTINTPIVNYLLHVDKHLSKNNVGALSQITRKVFENCCYNDVICLTKSKCDSLRIAACWELYRKNCEIRNDHHLHNVFANFDEDFMLKNLRPGENSNTPKWWNDNMLKKVSAKELLETILATENEDNKYFYWVNDRIQIEKQFDISGNTKGGYTVQTLLDNIKTERSIPANPNSLALLLDYLVLNIQQNCTYFAYYPSVAGGYKISKLDAKGKLIWQALCWSHNFYGGYTGIPSHYSTFVLQDNVLHVYGLASGMKYYETFDATTGRPLCKFSGLFWQKEVKKWNLKY